MQPILAPDLIRREYELKVQNALRRHISEHHRYDSGHKLTFRRRLGRWLVAAGTRLAQERHAAGRSLPVGGVSIVSSTDC